MDQQLLPLGSVVLLKGGRKKLLIFGRLQISNDDQKLWDYVGCLYPEGNLGPEYCFLFNRPDVEKVVHTGYSDEEDRQLLERYTMTLSGRNGNQEG